MLMIQPKWCYGQAYDSAQMMLRSDLWISPNDAAVRLMIQPKWWYGQAYDSAQNDATVRLMIQPKWYYGEAYDSAQVLLWSGLWCVPSWLVGGWQKYTIQFNEILCRLRFDLSCPKSQNMPGAIINISYRANTQIMSRRHNMTTYNI